MTLTLSQHARARVRQRGLREENLKMIVEPGTLVDGGSVLLTKRDVAREIRKHKQMITELERLCGSLVVLANNKVVTYYRPGRRTEKRLLRGIPRRRPRTTNHLYSAR